jgi:hypothetical protein
LNYSEFTLMESLSPEEIEERLRELKEIKNSKENINIQGNLITRCKVVLEK